MPSILFHELIGYKFAEKYKQYNTEDFYLGLIVPDAVNAYGFASKEKRWKAHFRDSNLEKWKMNILIFYKESKEKYENTYLMGYLIHVLTDILCDEIYSQEIYPQLIKKGFKEDIAYNYYYDAITKLENNNINEKWWKDTIRKIQQAKIIEINNLNVKIIDDWIKYTIEKYKSRNYEEIGFIENRFVNQILEEIDKILIKDKIL